MTQQYIQWIIEDDHVGFLAGNVRLVPMDRRIWKATVHRCTESDMMEAT